MTVRSRIPAGLAIVACAAAVGLLVDGARPWARRTAPHATDATAEQRIAARKLQFEQLAGTHDPATALRTAWQHESDHAARLEILNAAAHVPDRAGLVFLAEVASSNDPLASHAGADIGTIANSRVVHELARVARSDASVLVRANAVRALARSGGDAEIDTLTALVADGSAPWRVRQEAALSLGSIGDDAATPGLGATLDALANDAGDPAMQLRISIVQALGRIHSTGAISALLRHQARQLAATEAAFVAHALAV